MTGAKPLTAKQKRTIQRQVDKELRDELEENSRQFFDGIDPEELGPKREDLPKLLDGSDYDWSSFDWPTDRD